MRTAFFIATSTTLMDAPWFILCILPFMPMSKINVKTMVWRMFLVAFITYSIMFLGTALLMTNRNMLLLNVIHTLTYLPMLLIFHRSFDVGWSKIFYVFLFEQSIATEVNLLSYHVTLEIFHKPPSLVDNFWQLISAYLLLLVIFPISWVSLKGPIRQAMVILTEKQVRTLCITPLLFFIMVYYYTVAFQQSSLSAGHRVLFSLFFTFIGVSAYTVNLLTTMDIVKKGKLELEVVSMEQQLIRQSDRFEQIKNSIAQTRRIRHDLRHHLTVMRTYLTEENYSGLKQYLDEYLTHMPQENEAAICRNFAVDVLVKNYLGLAREIGTQVDVKIDLPEKTGIPDSQLCIVFGNLVENALNACQEQRTGEKFIRIRCRTEGKQILLTIDNSTDDQGDILPGIGLSSVEAVVERYQGTFNYHKQEGVFQASLLLCIP